jgi:hypothetical protein
MFEAIAAALVLAVCVALLLRHALPPQRRQRVDAWAAGLWHRLRAVRELPEQIKRQRSVQREANDVIERARRGSKGGNKVEREGNVYRPDAFKSSRPPSDRLH